jgi:Cu(I)/Ag(I) efflux system membrane fusion protein
MALIPLTDEEDSDAGPRQLTVSETAKALMDIEVVPVERKFVTSDIRMTGKVDYDETNLAYITAWVPGRLDRLFVDYTGVPVSKGDHMVSLYSPELISAQEELIQAVASAKKTERSDSGIMHEMTISTAQAARQKLSLWGLTDEQIAEIEKSGKAPDHTTIYAKTSGIVIHKNAVEGMYVETGTKIYTIADLSNIWVKLDAFETDLQWLVYGQQVEFTTLSYPGEKFTGTISFIDPVLDERTRTVKVRVNVNNTDGRLKPGMFVKASVRARIASSGRVMSTDLAGKWICPMHPEIIKDTASTCDICMMPLVKTESLGYASDDTRPAEKPLVIPVSAALITGKRAVVYVKLRGKDKPTFEGRTIDLGPRAGDYYLVKDGLKEGELVVVNGNFKIDSALQILAKPSMMNPQSQTPTEHQHKEAAPEITPIKAINPAFLKELKDSYNAYFNIQKALAGDKFEPALKAAKEMQKTISKIDTATLTDPQRKAWTKTISETNSILTASLKTKNIKLLREQFYLLSQNIIATAKQFGTAGQSPLYILHCPMAFDNRGADWLQPDKDTLNPYFGQMMLKCGGVTDTISPAVTSERQDN